MFNLFKSKKTPLNADSRQWIEAYMLWLSKEFTLDTIKELKVVTPTFDDLPVQWSQSEENAWELMEIIAKQMHIDPDEVDLEFYDGGLAEINMGTSVIFMEQDPDDPQALGLYYGKNEHGKYDIAINNRNFENPTELIATIAHELAHVKLLGERRTTLNDELLTDLTAGIFGFGIFVANCSFQFYTRSDRWGSQSNGYVKSEEWGYALALFAFLREEENPTWVKYLNQTIRKDFERSMKYILAHKDEVMVFDRLYDHIPFISVEPACFWIGTIESIEQFDDFFGKENDDSVASRFEKSQQTPNLLPHCLVNTYWTESQAVDDLDDFFLGEYPDRTLLIEKLKEYDIQSFNALVIYLDDFNEPDIENPCSIDTDGIELKYLGVFGKS